MRRRHAAALVAALVLRATEAGAGDRLAARIGGAPVTVADVDRRCGEKCTRLLAALAEKRSETLAVLIDEALLAGAPRPTPAVAVVRDQDVARYLTEHAGEFSGPAERDRSAVRFFLERERTSERNRRVIADARRGHAPSAEDLGLRAEDRDPAVVVARVGDLQIRRRDVDERAALALYRLEGELARERLRQLDGLIDEQLWTAAAAQRGVTVEALRTSVQAQAAPVTDDDVERYFATELRARDPQAVQRADRIRPYLEFRARHAAEDAFLAGLRRSAGVTILLREPDPPHFELAPGPGGFRGPARPRVRLLLLTSYRGEASRRIWALLQEVVEQDAIALGVRPLLPQWDPEAASAAAAARCAGEQGRFWEMQDAVSRALPLPDEDAALSFARALGLDQEGLRACMRSAATREAIAADSAAAERRGLVEPPLVLVDGRVLGAPSRGRLVAAIEAAARSLPAATPAPARAPGLSAPSSSASASP